MKNKDIETQVHKIDDEWSYFIAQVSADPDFLEDYSVAVIRLVDGINSWMYCGHCKHPDEAEEIARSSVEGFKRYPADWDHANVAVTAPAKESMLEIAVAAAAGGHDLGGFGLVVDHDDHPNGYQARCRKCDLTVWVDFDGMVFNLLADRCPNRASNQEGGSNGLESI